MTSKTVEELLTILGKYTKFSLEINNAAKPLGVVELRLYENKIYEPVEFINVIPKAIYANGYNNNPKSIKCVLEEVIYTMGLDNPKEGNV